MDYEQLKPPVKDEICALAMKYGLDKVILFGSRARGDYTKKSDIDLAVCGGDITRFAIDIEENAPTLLNFDVVDIGGNVNVDLLKSVKEEGIVLYEKI